MSIVNYSDRELISYLDYSSDDPVIKRLLEIGRKYSDLVAALERNNISEELEFDGYHILDVIDQKDNEISYLTTQLEDLEEQVRKLSMRTIAELLASVSEQLQENEMHEAQLARSLRESHEREELLKNKLSMWTKLNGHFN